MRLQNINPARPAFYDRAVENVTRRFSTAAVGPHSLTARITYTVPTGVKAYVDLASAHVFRDGVPTTPGTITILFEYTPSGGGPVNIVQLNHLSRELNVLSTTGPMNLGYLLSGDQLRVLTSDDSTGGTATYVIALKIFEFEA